MNLNKIASDLGIPKGSVNFRFFDDTVSIKVEASKRHLDRIRKQMRVILDGIEIKECAFNVDRNAIKYIEIKFDVIARAKFSLSEV